ncbi:hypothetical protein D3C84_955870 [compost metagenome]
MVRGRAAPFPAPWVATAAQAAEDGLAHLARLLQVKADDADLERRIGTAPMLARVAAPALDGPGGAGFHQFECHVDFERIGVTTTLPIRVARIFIAPVARLVCGVQPDRRGLQARDVQAQLMSVGRRGVVTAVDLL